MTRRPPTPKKSRPEARRRRRDQTHQRNRHRHSASRPDRGHRRQDPHRRCVADPAQACGLPPRTQRRLPLDRQEQSADLAARYCPALRHRGEAQPDFEEPSTIAHGRIEQRAIWTTTALNEHLNFPGVGQVFMIRRARHSKATGKASIETAYGVHKPHPRHRQCTKHPDPEPRPWCIENTAHHCLDWSWDEDRSRIRTGNGPENTTRLRRFAIGLIKARGLEVAQTLRKLNRNVRCVFDFLKMTANTQPLPNRSKASTTRSKSSREWPTDSATTNTSSSKSEPLSPEFPDEP